MSLRLLLLFGLGLAVGAHPRPDPSVDPRAEKLFEEGTALYANERFDAAALKFEEAAARKFNRVTTASIYLAGICHYQNNDLERALGKFQFLLKNYPESIYVPEATYHKALAMLLQPDKVEGGLYLLYGLSESAAEPALADLAQKRILHYLYREAGIGFLQDYLAKCRPAARTQVAEALAWKLHSANRRAELKALLESLPRQGIALSPNLMKLRQPAKAAPVQSNEVRIAFCAPLDSLEADGKLSPRQKFALSFYTGLMQGFALNAAQNTHSITLRYFDTRKDPKHTRQLTEGELRAFRPDIILGDIYNGPSQVLAEFAAQNNILQLVPFSPSTRLVENKQTVFLATPSTLSMAKALTTYLLDSLKLRRVMLMTDGSSIAELLLEKVRLQFQQRDSTTYRLYTKKINNVLDIEAAHQSLRSQHIEALYAPMASPTFTNYMLTTLYQDSLPLQVFGLQDWLDMTLIDDELLYNLNVIFPVNRIPDNDSLAQQVFSQSYARHYRCAPSREAFQGADVACLILKLLAHRRPGQSYAEALADLPPLRGINQDYVYRGQPDNQVVGMVQLRNARARCVSRVVLSAHE